MAADTTVDWFYVSPPLVTDADGNADVSGADFAIAFADEIEKPAHHQARFTLGC
jgi:uncharacterized protein